MKTVDTIEQELRRLDGKGYAAYQDLRGEYSFPNFTLHLDRIPKDPYAPPGTGSFRVVVPRERAKFHPEMTELQVREVALRDYLARRFFINCRKISKGRRGTGSSGIITIVPPGQAILERSSIVISDDFVEARFFMGLPAAGRRISAKIAAVMLFDELPEIVRLSLFLEDLDEDDIYKHIKTAEDAQYLRDNLSSHGLVAFVADGASLPRASGIDEIPLGGESVVPFVSPQNLQVKMELPNSGSISGMGVRKGVTLIIGGGYHGKSTLLKALELGVYNHIPGDGREFCVSLPQTVKVRASNGRYVAKTDISNFINNLPFEKDTSAFSTQNASGSTSQAASISEAIEVGAEVLLLDEDTCATNFMIRDRRMQQLVDKEDEPITAFIDNVGPLYKEKDVSTIIVMGGSGDYFSAADCVIQMKEFVPYDVTEKAHEISQKFPSGRAHEGGDSFATPRDRIPLGQSLNPYNKSNRVRVSASEPDKLIYGQNTIDLSDVEQIIETAQTRAIASAIYYAKKYMDGSKTLAEIIRLIMEDINRDGIDVLDGRLRGDLAGFRTAELAAALNRMRGFDVKQLKIR